MPVTIKSASHEANLITGAQGVDHARELLDLVVGQGSHGDILQSSLDGDNIPPVLLAHKNGFVNAVTTAYSHHHHLIIRPEDIWLAIISQFSFYVNKHAEELRGQFVAHEGQKKLEIEYEVGDRYSIDFGDFAQQIGELISQNVVDEAICKWITPDFSTTTKHDVVVASIVMMGTLQKYFRYYAMVCCGIPYVTLLGTKEDYERILTRLDKLASYGEESAAFGELLKPVTRCFIRSFEEPEHPDVLRFWQKICDEEHGSGFDSYTGWITVFCFWDSEGNRQVLRDWDLCPDGVRSGCVEMEQIPSGFTTAPVHINDNGEDLEAEILAGSIGVSCISSGKPSADGSLGLDTMQPQLGWLIYEKA